MKALTLTQPWATLVAIGAKQIETRSWRTKYCGPLAIHAANGFPYWARKFTTQPACYEAIRVHTSGRKFWPGEVAYPTGAVLCTCRLVECLPVEELGQRDSLFGSPFPVSEQERSFGDYSPGRFAWILQDVQPLPLPIPAKGALGLWEWSGV